MKPVEITKKLKFKNFKKGEVISIKCDKNNNKPNASSFELLIPCYIKYELVKDEEHIKEVQISRRNMNYLLFHHKEKGVLPISLAGTNINFRFFEREKFDGSVFVSVFVVSVSMGESCNRKVNFNSNEFEFMDEDYLLDYIQVY